MVYVLDINGQPLMPTNRYGKVRRLLNSKKAKVVKRCPFTIKLLYESTHYIQYLSLGVDTGSSMIGTAVITETNKVVYMSQVEIRNDMTDKMTQRKKYRRNRRNRKTRYREARWRNRKNSIKTDRFSPTMVSKLNSHVKEIEYIKSILPIKKLILETGNFDPGVMKFKENNPSDNENLSLHHWWYQKTIDYEFQNTRAIVLDRDSHTCQYCKGKHKDSKLEVHHIVFKSKGGSDDKDNLITLCHTCHKKLHAGEIELNKVGKVKGTLKHATQMNSIRVQLLKHYPDAIETFGYITKANRIATNLPKEHYYDACVIAMLGNHRENNNDDNDNSNNNNNNENNHNNNNNIDIQTLLYKKKCISKGDYQKTKGVRSEQKLPTGKIGGFKKYDKVLYNGKEYFIKGRMSSGYAVLMDIEGNKIDFSFMPKGFKTPKLANLKRLEARSTWIIINEELIQNTA